MKMDPMDIQLYQWVDYRVLPRQTNVEWQAFKVGLASVLGSLQDSLVPRPSIAGGRPGIHCLCMRLISPKILENRISQYSSVKR